MIYRETDYLAHYGVKGQKWGVRRAIKNTSGNVKRVARNTSSSVKKAYKNMRKNQRAEAKANIEKHGLAGSLARTTVKNYGKRYVKQAIANHLETTVTEYAGKQTNESRRKAMNFAAKFGAQALRYSAAIDRGQVLLDSYNLGEAYASGVRKKK